MAKDIRVHQEEAIVSVNGKLRNIKRIIANVKFVKPYVLPSIKDIAKR